MTDPGTTSTDSNTTGTENPNPTPAVVESFGSHPEEAFYEFIIFMIPCFLFILISLKRISTLNNQPYTNPGIHKQMSFYIKQTLSIFHVLIYSVQLVLAAILTPEVYWVTEYRSGALVYLLGVVSWTLSFKLLSKEVDRGLYQKLYAHRMFWVLHFILVCVKIADPIEQKPVPLVLNILKIVGGFYLTLYALAKPFDSDEADELQGKTNPLPLVRKLLVGIEDMQCTRSLVGDRPFGLVSPLLSPRHNSEHELDAEAFKGFLGSQNKATGITQQSDWGKSLPPVTCTISKEVIAKEEAGKTRIFYEVKTNIKDETYITTHKYGDFETLEDYVKKRCDPSKVTWLERSPPEFEKVQMSGFPDEKSFINARREILEKFLNILVSDPKFLNDEVISFLGIQDPYKGAYGRYINYLTNQSKKKATPLVSQGSVELGPMSTSQKKKKTTNEGYIASLKVRCSHYQKSIYGDHYEYIFVVLDEKDPSNNWSIIKSYGDFKTFHENLEKAVNKTIPYLNQFIPKPLNQKQTMDPSFVEKRKQGLDMYINMILKQPAYHTGVLYEFLEFDVKRGTHASRGASPRISALVGHSNE